MTTLKLAPIVVDQDGQRSVYMVADVPDDAPWAVREGLARRRICAATGRCPCGAQLEMPAPEDCPPGSVTHVDVVHEYGCPAADKILRRAFRRWRR